MPKLLPVTYVPQQPQESQSQPREKVLATKPRLRVLAFVFGLSSGNFAASICSYLNENGIRTDASQTGVKFTQLPS